MQGIIKHLREDRGFGFVIVENGDELFFHASHAPAFDEMRLGDRVEFKTQPSRTKADRMEAIDVRLVN
jgi:cold shock CspA family protein